MRHYTPPESLANTDPAVQRRDYQEAYKRTIANLARKGMATEVEQVTQTQEGTGVYRYHRFVLPPQPSVVLPSPSVNVLDDLGIHRKEQFAVYDPSLVEEYVMVQYRDFDDPTQPPELTVGSPDGAAPSYEVYAVIESAFTTDLAHA